MTKPITIIEPYQDKRGIYNAYPNYEGLGINLRINAIRSGHIFCAIQHFVSGQQISDSDCADTQVHVGFRYAGRCGLPPIPYDLKGLATLGRFSPFCTRETTPCDPVCLSVYQSPSEKGSTLK